MAEYSNYQLQWSGRQRKTHSDPPIPLQIKRPSLPESLGTTFPGLGKFYGRSRKVGRNVPQAPCLAHTTKLPTLSYTKFRPLMKFIVLLLFLLGCCNRCDCPFGLVSFLKSLLNSRKLSSCPIPQQNFQFSLVQFADHIEPKDFLKTTYTLFECRHYPSLWY